VEVCSQLNQVNKSPKTSFLGIYSFGNSLHIVPVATQKLLEMQLIRNFMLLHEHSPNRLHDLYKAEKIVPYGYNNTRRSS
jgi:hypothetical protein